MKEEDNLIRVFTGTEITASILKEELGKNNIPAIIKNNYNSGIIAGFSSGTSSSIELYIQEIYLKKAEPIIKQFILINK